MKCTGVVDVLESIDSGKGMMVEGWVRIHRSSKAVDFVTLNDGSTIKNTQIVVDPLKISADTLKSITTGACFCVTDTLVESQGKGQSAETQCQNIKVYGLYGNGYSVQEKGQLFEYMRQYAHMCLRTDILDVATRIRHSMALVIHQYFHEHGFFYFHIPLITAPDAKSVGEMLQVAMQSPNSLKKGEDGKVNYEDDFSGKMTSLTVSGQSGGELGATTLGQIYTFELMFRVENSDTPCHLAELQTIGPETAFTALPDLMDLGEDFAKHCVRWTLDSYKGDPDFLNSIIDKTLLERLQGVLKNNFVRLTYTDGIRILEEAATNGHKSGFPVSWRMDLASEHERFLVEHHFRKPVIMYNYPKEIKAFYMKINENDKTIQSTDILFPQIGEIIGGSVREESPEKLTSEIERRHIPTKDMRWCFDTRKYNTYPHGGFGLGFERLILFVTGMQNIRDVIPPPRTPENAEF